MTNKINNLEKALISNLEECANNHQKACFQLLEKGMQSDFETSDILKDFFMFPSEIKGFRKATKAVQDFFDSRKEASNDEH